jgi:hypothetical protein
MDQIGGTSPPFRRE